MNRRHLYRSALMAAFLLLAFGRFARSEITHVGVPLRIATADAANANDIAFDDKHQVYLVVWSTASYSSPQGHTYGQFISADGQRISTFLISRGEQAYATMPRVAYSSGSADDAFLVVYGSDVNHPDATNLFGQLLRYNPTTHDPDFITPPGSLTTNFPVSRNSGDYTYAQYAGGIAYNPISHNFLVSWYCAGHGDDAWTRLINVDGTPVNNDKNLSAAPYSQGGTSVAFDPVNQRFLVAYAGDTADGLSIGIFTALIDGVTGDPIGNPMTTVSTGGELEAFALYLPELQTFLVGWTEMAATRDVMGRKVDTNGVPYGAIYPLMQTFAGGTVPLNEGAASGAYNPNTHSILIAAMHDSGNIWGAELSGLGLPLQTMQLSTTVSTGGGSYTPRVTAQANEFGFSYALDFLAMYFERVQGGPAGPTLVANPSSPVGAGIPITWTATSSKTTAQEYRFWRFDGTTWTIVQDYTASNTYTWASPTPGTYTFQVWIRAAGATNSWDEWTSAAMVVTPPPVTSVTVTPSATSVLPGTPITWTAVATGGVPPVQYQFFLKDLGAGTPFTVVQAYSSSDTFTLSAPTGGSYLVQVWARSDGSGQAQQAWANSAPVTVGVVAVVVTPSKTSATTGSTVTFTATAVGGVAPVQYRFWMKNLDAGGAYAEVQGYSPSPTWTLGGTTGAGPGRYLVEVWARSAGSTVPYESYGDAPMVTVAPAPLVVTAVTSDYATATDGTAITWTATATGGTPPLQYRFYRRDASGTWTVVQDYGASNKYTWPSAEVGTYMIEAWARSFGSSNPYDAYGDAAPVVVTPLARVASATVTPSAVNAVPGSSVTWTANAIGGVQPVQYDFWLKNMDTGTWAEVQPYSSSTTWTMTNAAAGRYVVEVWARSDGATRKYDTYVDSAVVTIGTLPVTITGVTPSATTTYPGSALTWTAAATGGTAPLQYRFYRYDSTTGWTMVQDYSTSNTYTWSGVAVGTYVVEVWVRSAGSTRQFEAYQDAVPVAVIPRPPVTSVTVTPSQVTAPLGTSVRWSATATGGVAPYEYRFFLLNLGTGVWTEVASYSTWFVWPTMIPAVLPVGTYVMQVWVRGSGSTVPYEAFSNSVPVTITEPPAPVIDSFTASATSVIVGTPVALSATTSGGVPPVVYTFFIRDDSTGVWTQLQTGASNSCSVTPLHAGSYMIEVWVSSYGATTPYQAYADIVLFAQ